MALANLARRPERDDETILDAISGNLCRCTGYRPIIDAARALPYLPAPDGEAQQAAELAARTVETLHYRAGDQRFLAPASLEEALEIRVGHPEAWILAGGTDLGLRITKRHEVPKNILWLGRVADVADDHRARGRADHRRGRHLRGRAAGHRAAQPRVRRAWCAASAARRSGASAPWAAISATPRRSAIRCRR